MALRDNRASVGNAPLRLSILLSVLGVFTQFPTLAFAIDYSATEALFFQGKYDQCMAVCQAEVDRGVWNEKWPALLLRCQLTTGRYEAAEASYQAAAARFKNSIGLRMIGRDVYRFVDKPQRANRCLLEITNLVKRSPWRYSSSSDRLVLGRFFLAIGEDAREVLEFAYDRARKSNPRRADVHIATAELALQKHDYQEAAKSLQVAVELQPANPHIHFLIARAWESSDPEKTSQGINTALQLNPGHTPSLLFQVDHLIDAEQYQQASDLLTRVLEVNYRHPLAWAYHAVIAHLTGHYTGEARLREAALSTWSTNPNVDHLIGRKLSRSYRFAEGAEYQRRALALDPNMLPAKLQLSQDLLRLGKEEEGWKLATEVHDQDGYNVVAYNAVTLRDEMDKFATLETDRFIVRMDARESRIYGRQVLELLHEAHDFLCQKYDVSVDGPVIVEIFPQQKDFAIRTFGLPGGAGFLGVCFGRVITANSPSSQGERPANWRSVLWHEFCHVVTLEKTNNKMPRWISEGISTYEEQQKTDSWGERLTPAYRRMINSDDLTPVSQLSGAFLSPKSPQHLQFAYFESSLVVRFLIERYGLETLKRILTDLGVGMPINESLARYAGSLESMDDAFQQYARDYAQAIGHGVDWEIDPELAKRPIEGTKKWLEDHPSNYQAMIRYAKLAIEEEQFAEAERTLLQLRERYPEDRDGGGTLALLGLLYRRTNEPQKEREVLSDLSRLNDRALEVYARLIELHRETGDWERVLQQVQRYLSVQPMLPYGYEQLATAAEHLGRADELVSALTALLEMDPIDPAELHFRIARGHRDLGERPQAKRQVLKALEYAPRYRDAQRLLLELVQREDTATRTTETSITNAQH